MTRIDSQPHPRHPARTIPDIYNAELRPGASSGDLRAELARHFNLSPEEIASRVKNVFPQRPRQLTPAQEEARAKRHAVCPPPEGTERFLLVDLSGLASPSARPPPAPHAPYTTASAVEKTASLSPVIERLAALSPSYAPEALIAPPAPPPSDPAVDPLSFHRVADAAGSRPSAHDVVKGRGVVVGFVESTDFGGVDYSRAELGGTRNRAADWRHITTWSHPKFRPVMRGAGPNDPFDADPDAHGNLTVPAAVATSVPQPTTDPPWLGSAPDAMTKVCLVGPHEIVLGINELATDGCDVIVVPYGVLMCTKRHPGFREAVQYAGSEGAVVVAAHWANTHLFGPVKFASCEAVFVTTGDLHSTARTSRGPGVSVASLANGLPVNRLANQSMAAAFVGGVVALIREAFPGDNIFEVQRKLLLGASPLGALRLDETHGYGKMNAYAAVTFSTDDPRPLPPFRFRAERVAAKGGRPVIRFEWRRRPMSQVKKFRISLRSKKNGPVLSSVEVEVSQEAYQWRLPTKESVFASIEALGDRDATIGVIPNDCFIKLGFKRGPSPDYPIERVVSDDPPC